MPEVVLVVATTNSTWLGEKEAPIGCFSQPNGKVMASHQAKARNSRGKVPSPLKENKCHQYNPSQISHNQMLLTRIATRRSILREIGIFLLIVGFLEIQILSCDAFQNHVLSPNNRKPSFLQYAGRNELAEPPKGVSSRNWRERPKKKRTVRTKRKNQQERKDEVFSSGKFDRACVVESKVRNALGAFQEALKINAEAGTVLERYPLQFPGIRECNAALASFGDADDLLRALRLYFTMRKLTALSESNPPKNWQAVPSPTLVTFSTLMSRAMYAGKPMIAIRIWNMMRQEPSFFTSTTPSISSSEVRSGTSQNIEP